MEEKMISHAQDMASILRLQADILESAKGRDPHIIIGAIALALGSAVAVNDAAHARLGYPPPSIGIDDAINLAREYYEQSKDNVAKEVRRA